MGEENSFENVQRRHSSAMAKHEWTSSLMNMKNSGHEIHDRRTKSHRKANEFLQELLQRRSDGSVLDDHGSLDRYRKFLKYKTNLNDDDVLNEFERRLRSLNKDRYQQWKRNPTHSMTMGLQTTSESPSGFQSLNRTDRINSLSKSTLTTNFSSEGTQTNLLLNSDEYLSSSLDRSSSSSLTSHGTTKTIHRPKARRADGTEIVAISSRARHRRASSDILIFRHCYFPRALKAREQIQTESIFEKPTLLHSIEQYDATEVMDLLDQIENKCSAVDFATMLDRLAISTVQIENHLSENENSQLEELENVLVLPPNLFDRSSVSDDYYQSFDVLIDDPKQMSVYTMTIGLVQFSPTRLVPYSILNGRRPFLQCSNQTKFKRIHSKQAKQTCQVTAIESVINMETLQENDILLKIDNHSVWDLTTDLVRTILEQSNQCVLTIARLCQPTI